MIGTEVWIGGMIGLVIGGLAGYLAKCRSGTSPASGSPYVGAIIGAILGALVGLAIGDRATVPPGDHTHAGVVTPITSTEQFGTVVLQSPRLVMVDFSATWCGPCKILAPTLDALAAEYAGRVDFVKVDIDQLRNLASQYEIRGVPTVVLIRSGGEINRWVGVQPAEAYRQVLNAILPQSKPREEPPMKPPTASVTMKGNPMTLTGNTVNVGDEAPDFVAVDTDLKDVRLSDYRGKVALLLSVPSLDTSVCSRETRRFNEAAAGLGEDVVILAISMDLPFAQKRWCGAEGITAVRTLSDHRDAAFGQAYGVLMADLRLLARAVFVVGKDAKIWYKQLVGEVTSEPDYDAALAAVARAVKA